MGAVELFYLITTSLWKGLYLIQCGVRYFIIVNRSRKCDRFSHKGDNLNQWKCDRFSLKRDNLKQWKCDRFSLKGNNLKQWKCDRFSLKGDI